ncbi:MAG: 3-oxoacyl-ACP reductase family protein [Thermodesulfobacteriota bacterium]
MNGENNNQSMKVKASQPVAVVTGGATGIGAACCRSLSQQGFRVGIHHHTSLPEAEALRNELSGAFLISADLRETTSIDGMMSALQEKTGRVDVLVNNAGMAINATMGGMRIEQFDAQRWMARGAWYLAKRILRKFMLRQAGGRIINISSVVGHTGNAGQIPYAMEKAALDAMTRSLALEVAARNILVNSVAPGFIRTDMTARLSEEIRRDYEGRIPLGRMGLPEEVAEVVAFLCGNGGSYITGAVIHVNGGLYGG